MGVAYFWAAQSRLRRPRDRGRRAGARPRSPACDRDVPSQIGRVHDLIKIMLISYCMIDNDNKLIVICFGLKS